MASFNIRLAVGKRYLEKNNNIKDEAAFYAGIIEPDLVDNKDVSHYTGIRNKDNLLEYLANKVLLDKYLENVVVDTDYEKGVFIHLITDYLYFNNFFDKDYLSNISYSEFCKDLYYSYDITNKYLEDKYKIDYSKFIDRINTNIQKDRKEKDMDDEIRTNILPSWKLDSFIEYVADIDIEEYKNKIIEVGHNILP